MIPLLRALPLTAIVGALLLAGLQLPVLMRESGHVSLDADVQQGLPNAPPDVKPPALGEEPLRFGLDAGGIHGADQAGARPDYGTLWVGRWNNEQGWRGTDATLVDLNAQNVTPLVHLYYWGDDIQEACFTLGCNGKDMNGWNRLAQDLPIHLQQALGGGPVVIVLETEFNKHGVHDFEPLDGYLEEKARALKSAYPAAYVVLGLGNWYPEAWGTWDRAAAASDAVGLQALAGESRDGPDKPRALIQDTLAGVEEAADLFDKPLVVTDVAVSSYPEPQALDSQADALAAFADGFDELREAGVEAVVYRSLLDVPDMGIHNTYGEAERHWGLAWSGTGQLKPAGEAWIAGVQAERGEAGVGASA